MARKSNRSGSVFFSESENRWRAEIHWVDKNGKSNFKKFSGKKKQIVVNKLDEFKRSLLISEGNLSNSDVTFQEFSDDYMKTNAAFSLKPSSFMRKETTLNNQVYPFIGNIPIERIEYQDVQNMIDELNKKNLSYSTIKKAYTATNEMFKIFRVRTKKYINPCEGIVLPTAKKKDISNVKILSPEQKNLINNEIRRTYKNGKPVYRLGRFIPVLMYTGMRMGGVA